MDALFSMIFRCFLLMILISRIKKCHGEELNSTINANGTPKIIYESKNARIWHLKDNETFLQSKIYLYFKLMKPMKRNFSPLNAALLCIFEKLIIYDKSQSLTSTGSGANSITALHSGYALQFIGNDESEVRESILNTFQAILSIPNDQHQFQVAKNKCMTGVSEVKKETPLELASKLSILLQLPLQWPDDELFASLQTIVFEQIGRFKQEFFTNLGIELFAYGKIDAQAAIEMLKGVHAVIQKSFTIQPVFAHERQGPWTISLPPGSEYRYSTTFTSTTTEKSTAAVCLIYRTFSLNTIKRVLLQEFTYFLIKSLFFHTELQNISVRSTPFSSIEFLAEDLESTPDDIDSKIEYAIKAVETQLISMPEEVFQLYKNLYAKSFSNKTESMDQVAMKFWREIRDEEYCFNRDHQMLAAIRDLSKADVITYYKRMFDSDAKRRKKFAIYVYSSQNQKEDIIPLNQTDYDENYDENYDEIDWTKKIHIITNIKPLQNGLPMVVIPRIRSGGVLPLGAKQMILDYHLH